MVSNTQACDSRITGGGFFDSIAKDTVRSQRGLAACFTSASLILTGHCRARLDNKKCHEAMVLKSSHCKNIPPDLVLKANVSSEMYNYLTLYV